MFVLSSSSSSVAASSSLFALPTASSSSQIPRPVWRSLATPRRTLYSARELSLLLPTSTELFAHSHRFSLITDDDSLDSLLLLGQAAELAAAIQALSLAASGDPELDCAAAELVAAGTDLLHSAARNAVEVDFSSSSTFTIPASPTFTSFSSSLASSLRTSSPFSCHCFFPSPSSASSTSTRSSSPSPPSTSSCRTLSPRARLSPSVFFDSLRSAACATPILVVVRAKVDDLCPRPRNAPSPPSSPESATASSSARKVVRAVKKDVKEQGKRWRF
ncbi:hypothetical protein JCM8547_002846 [Rhodosporidiobolus lusitaniae]